VIFFFRQEIILLKPEADKLTETLYFRRWQVKREFSYNTDSYIIFMSLNNELFGNSTKNN